jgi:hypothetical protein
LFYTPAAPPKRIGLYSLVSSTNASITEQNILSSNQLTLLHAFNGSQSTTIAIPIHRKILAGHMGGNGSERNGENKLPS